MQYNFKKITTVRARLRVAPLRVPSLPPSAAAATENSPRLFRSHDAHLLASPGAHGEDFIDVVPSRTQRQTPTVHRGYAITRIRQFYMRKVKYTQTSWNEKLSKILEDFPRVDDIIPSTATSSTFCTTRTTTSSRPGSSTPPKTSSTRSPRTTSSSSSTATRSTMQAAQASGAGLCTIMKKHAAARVPRAGQQHMSCLPSIDPNTRTILVCGYPNGVSSFMNKVTRADVEVQPYASTMCLTHTDYKYLRWQVLDTPGILDRPLEERNTSRASITAWRTARGVLASSTRASSAGTPSSSKPTSSTPSSRSSRISRHHRFEQG